jgi:hypothetical protein
VLRYLDQVDAAEGRAQIELDDFGQVVELGIREGLAGFGEGFGDELHQFFVETLLVLKVFEEVEILGEKVVVEG